MTRRNSISTIHEPFGDAYYYGPERMGTRFETDEKARSESGFSDSTFKTIMDRIEREADEVRLPTSSPVAFPIAVESHPSCFCLPLPEHLHPSILSF